MDYMGIAPEKRILAKPSIKTCLYSIVYGMEIDKAQKILTDELVASGVQCQQDFTTHAIVIEVSNAVHVAMKSIEVNKGMKGAYGFIPLGYDDINSILACVVQSYETALITEVYRVAIEEKASGNSTFDITLHSHDGVSLVLKNGCAIKDIERKLQDMVSLQAQKYDIRNMGIEVK